MTVTGLVERRFERLTSRGSGRGRCLFGTVGERLARTGGCLVHSIVVMIGRGRASIDDNRVLGVITAWRRLVARRGLLLLGQRQTVDGLL